MTSRRRCVRRSRSRYASLVGAVAALMMIPVAVGEAAAHGDRLGSTGPVASARPSPVDTALTVVPAGPMVSSLGPVEVRLAVRNPGATAVQASVTVQWRAPGGSSPLTDRVIELGPGETVLVDETYAASALLRRDRVTRGRIVTEVRVQRSVSRQSWRLAVVPSDTRALPILTTAWIEPGAYIDGVYAQTRPITERDVRDDMNSMHDLGIGTVVVAYSEYILNGWGAFYDSSLPELEPPATEFDVIGAILDEAERNGQHVYVGLGRGTDLYLTYTGFDDPERVAAGLDWSQRLANDLWERYGQSDAFYGWYLTHEAADIEGANNFYDPLTEYLGTFSPDKPVLIAPSGTPIASPEVIAGSEADVFAYQDAVGAGYIGPDASCLPACVGPHGTYTTGYAYTFNPANRIADLGPLYGTYEAWHAGSPKHIWADLELWQMDGPGYAAAYPAPYARVSQQIAAEAPHVDVLSAYAYPGFMADPSSSLQHGGPAAVDLYTDYRDYYESWRRLAVANG